MIFSNDNVQVQWAEQSGFRYKTMGWEILRAPLITFLSFLFVMLLIFSTFSWHAGRNPVDEFTKSLVPVFVASLAVALFTELMRVNRTIKISPSRISWGLPDRAFMFVGLYMIFCMGSRRFSAIEQIVVRRPKEEGNRFGHGVLEIIPHAGKPSLVGVADEIKLENLAQLLHDNHVAVTLSDWTPDEAAA